MLWWAWAVLAVVAGAASCPPNSRVYATGDLMVLETPAARLSLAKVRVCVCVMACGMAMLCMCVCVCVCWVCACVCVCMISLTGLFFPGRWAGCRETGRLSR
jgi:hypothetical protein